MMRSTSPNRLRSLLNFMFCAAVMVLAFSVATAQENTGAVQGIVKDTAGASIPGA